MKGATPYPGIELERLPYVLTALYAMLQLAHEAGMHTITYQTVNRFFGEYRALLSLLSNVDRAMALDSSTLVNLAPFPEPGQQRAFLKAMRDLLPRTQHRSRATLGEVLNRHAPPEGISRVAFLKRIARRLAGCLRPVADQHRERAQVRAPRAVLQRLALRYVSVDLLAEMTKSRA
jgi:hypothetical protein